MSIKPSIALLVLACSWASAADWAPLDIKPGVWETTISAQTSGTPPIPQALLDKMTPDQRAKMEDAMKARSGKTQTTVHRSCVKKEDLGKPLFTENQSKLCKDTLVSGTGSKRDVQLDCETPAGKATGTIHIDVVNSEKVKVTSQMSISAGANPMSTNTTSNGKWVGAVCTGKEQ